MIPISVVVIAKNEAHIIGATIAAAKVISDDIIIVDSGSADGTQQLATAAGCIVIETAWDGFGPNKNKGIAQAKHDWILSIDADEQPDAELAKNLQALDYNVSNIVYNIGFKTFLGKKIIRYGEWGNDSHIRLFNKKAIRWNDAEVHEQLIIPPGFTTQTLRGHILHYTMKDIAEYATKVTKYALLSAERYYKDGRKSTWINRNLSHRFAFVSNYIFKLGFLDGNKGYLIAKMTSFYTFLKYARLYELNTAKK